MINQDLIREIENLLYLQEQFLESKLDPCPYTTCGEVWDKENKFKIRKNEIMELLNNCVIYRK